MSQFDHLNPKEIKLLNGMKPDDQSSKGYIVVVAGDMLTAGLSLCELGLAEIRVPSKSYKLPKQGSTHISVFGQPKFGTSFALTPAGLAYDLDAAAHSAESTP